MGENAIADTSTRFDQRTPFWEFPTVAESVKDQVSLQQLKSLLSHGFDPQHDTVGSGSGVATAVALFQPRLRFNPWPGNYMLQVQPKKKQKNFSIWSSHCGSVETNLISTHEDTGSIPGLAQWVKDPALL